LKKGGLVVLGQHRSRRGGLGYWGRLGGNRVKRRGDGEGARGCNWMRVDGAVVIGHG